MFGYGKSYGLIFYLRPISPIMDPFKYKPAKFVSPSYNIKDFSYVRENALCQIWFLVNLYISMMLGYCKSDGLINYCGPIPPIVNPLKFDPARFISPSYNIKDSSCIRENALCQIW